MAKKITMPAGGQTSDKLKICKWHKNVGDPVKKGDILFEIETDKAVLEVESYAAGYLIAKYYDEGEEVTVGEIVAYIGSKDEKVPDSTQSIGDSLKTEKVDKEPEDEYVPIMKGEADSSDKPLATPLARETAKSIGLSLDNIASTMPGNVIYNQNVLDYKEKKTKESHQEKEFYYMPASNLRKTIAKRMAESTKISAHYSLFIDVNMTQVISLRKNFNNSLKDTGVKISVNDFIIKCATAAIKKIPEINATFEPEQIKIWNSVNFGVAVSVEDGIIVPVVKNCERISLFEIAKENSKNIKAVRDGKITNDMLSGGTITVSNMGMLGVSRFTSIINQPESTILSVGSIEDKTMVEKGQVVIRPMMTVTATFDHRTIDGARGAEFCKLLKEYLQDPSLLLL